MASIASLVVISGVVLTVFTAPPAEAAIEKVAALTLFGS